MSEPSVLLGHAAAVERLARTAQRGALGHALLFTGPDGVGKTTAATHLADRLLGTGAWPGGLAAHPDLWVEDGDAENLSIERVRAGGRDGPTLQDAMALRPYAGGRRVAIIGRCDRLTEQAANCLLKTIEEPPPETHLLLAAAHPEKLPATVLSRCEPVNLRTVATAEIAHWLSEQHGVPPDLAAVAAPLAGGAPGRALRLALQPGALEAELLALDRFLGTGGGGVAAALRTAAAVSPGAGAEGREQGLATLGVWAAFVRDAACFAAGTPELSVWAAYRPALERWAEDLAPGRIVAILGRIVTTSESVANYAQPRLAFEALLVDIFGGEQSPPPVDIPERPEPVRTAGAPAAAPRSRPRAPRGARPRGAGSRSR